MNSKNKGKYYFFHSNSIVISLSDMFSYFLLPYKSCTDIDTYIRPPFWPPFDNDLQHSQILNQWKLCEISNHRFFGVLIPFWYPFLDLRWSWRSWHPKFANIGRSKNEINENNSYEVSNHRFFGVLIPFWYSFLTSDDPEDRK